MRYESDYWDPGPKYERYLDKIRSVLQDEQRTVRDVYYALEARGFPEELQPDHTFEYRYVKRAVKKGRRAGFIDPDMIFDASRLPENEAYNGWTSGEAFTRQNVDGVWAKYTENFWRDQPKYVEVWLEKQSLASIFEPVCSEKNVRLEATRGDWSDSKVNEACQRLIDKIHEEKDIRILYFGDFNPSGLHAPVAIQNTMSHYGIDVRDDLPDDDRFYFDIYPFEGPTVYGTEDGAEATLTFERVALTADQIDRFDLPENPTPSSTDKDRELRERFMKLASGGRDVNIELNALKEYHRDFLVELLEDSIEQHIDDDLRSETQRRVVEERKKIESAIDIDYSVF